MALSATSSLLVTACAKYSRNPIIVREANVSLSGVYWVFWPYAIGVAVNDDS